MGIKYTLLVPDGINLECGWILCGGLSPPEKGKCGVSQGGIQSIWWLNDSKPCPLSSFPSHHECNPRPLLWPFAKAGYRSRYRDYVQRCCICSIGPRGGSSNPICHKASTSSNPWSSDKWRRTRVRYLNAPNLGSAKVPSVLYYDRDGNFCGIENGVDFQDDDELLRIKWWEAAILSPPQNAHNKLGGS